MKNIRIILIFFLLFTTSLVCAQKVKIKNNSVLINKEKIATIEADKSVPYSFYINDLSGNRLLYFKWILVEYNELVNGNLVERSIDYFEVYKAHDLENILYETQTVFSYKIFIIKNLYNANALLSNGLNEEKLDEFAIKMGKEFSRIRKEVRN